VIRVIDLRVNKMLENTEVAGRLAASQEELSFMGLVTSMKSYTVWDGI
jgi:hypothetical protein